MKIVGVSFSIVFACVMFMSFQQPSQKVIMDRGKIVYEKNCLSCHQADGSGVPRMNPPLRKTSWVTGDKQRLITIILKGMDEPLEINGEDFYNVMAPHDFLKDQEIADVLSYVRNSFGNKSSIVNVTEVRAVRAVRAKLLAKNKK